MARILHLGVCCNTVYRKDLMLSVVVPAYNENENVSRAAKTISRILEDAAIPFEIIFIDDGSQGETWGRICEESSKHDFVRGISFSRNFGKDAAIFAGLSEADGDCCAVMDCDLQQPPELLPEMYHLWESGYEVIEGRKKSRGSESAAHGLFAKLFYKLMSGAVHTDFHDASDFRLLDRKAVDSLLSMPEKHPFFRALSSWIGFRVTYVEYDVKDRAIGHSKWSVIKLFRYAVTNITSFTKVPMQIVTCLGAITFLVSIVTGIWALYQKFFLTPPDGLTTLTILIGFIGSILMISLGIVGLYLSRIYDEVQNRPVYIIARKTKRRGSAKTGEDVSEEAGHDRISR